jgi:sporadic carbohydrate cluster protein (TIGR04323 family)
MKKMRGYVTSRDFKARAPQHVQNLVIRNYCDQLGFQYLLSVVEHIMPKCSMILEQAVNTLETCDGIVLYSVWQLPELNDRRQYAYMKTLEQKKEMHFALERIGINSLADIRLVEELIQISAVMENL